MFFHTGSSINIYIHIYMYVCMYVCTYLHTYIHALHDTYILRTYIHTFYTYRFVGPQILSYNSRTWNLSEKNTHNTQTKQMTQYITIKQMSILQSPKSNTVHNIIIKNTIQNTSEIIYQTNYHCWTPKILWQSKMSYLKNTSITHF